MDDVESLLNHSPYAESKKEINGQCMETWNIALWNNHTQFVSHPYYQDYLWKKICRHMSLASLLHYVNTKYLELLRIVNFYEYSYLEM